jgi:hypothetical protein
MTLTAAQSFTFRTAIKADTDPTIVTAYAANDFVTIATQYNLAASPQVLIWRPRIMTSELNNAIVWSEYLLLTDAQRQTYSAMIVVGWIDATNANIRGGFGSVFTGTTSLTNLTTLAQVPATKFQNLFTTAGVCSLFGHLLDNQECYEALYTPNGTKI